MERHKAPRKPASGPVPAWAWPRCRQPLGNRSDVDRIHIGGVAYQLATGWPVIRLEEACGRPGDSWERVWLRLGNRGVPAEWLEGRLEAVIPRTNPPKHGRSPRP